MASGKSQDSPLRSIRDELEMSQTDFAALCGVSSHTITVTEQAGAQRISRKILGVLQELGYNVDELQAKHVAFMAERQAELLKQAKAKRANKD